jgi:hypothetical protein
MQDMKSPVAKHCSHDAPFMGVDAHCHPPPFGTAATYGKDHHLANRIGAIPLNISLTYSRMALAPYDISSLISPIVAVYRRWRNTQLDLTTYPGFASLASDGVPLLESIAFRKGTITRKTNLKEPFMLLDTPRLCSIKCADMSYIRECPYIVGIADALDGFRVIVQLYW